MQPEVDLVTSVDGGHQGAPELGVTQAQSVADFMGGHNSQVGAIIRALGPELVVIEVDHAGFWWLGVGQDATCRGPERRNQPSLFSFKRLCIQKPFKRFVHESKT